MNQKNWRRLRDGDKIIGKYNSAEYVISGPCATVAGYWLANGGTCSMRRNYRLSADTKARLRAESAAPTLPESGHPLTSRHGNLRQPAESAAPVPSAVTAADVLRDMLQSAATPVQPAAYVAGQAVEYDRDGEPAIGIYIQQGRVLDLATGLNRHAQSLSIRPCPASAGCVVMDRQTGEFGLCTAGMFVLTLHSCGQEYDPARHAVMLTPRQPAAPAEQPCEHCGGLDAYGPPVCVCNGTGKQPAEQPLQREIEAALAMMIARHTTLERLNIYPAVIEVAAAVPPDVTAADVQRAILAALAHHRCTRGEPGGEVDGL